MSRILLAHSQDVRRNYFRDQAVGALGRLGELRLNDTGAELPLQALLAAAHDCEVIVAYRETIANDSLFAALPSLKAYVRCAVDIRNIDLAAASRHGILVTRVGGVFVSGVAEWCIAMMIDLGRQFSAAIGAYRAGGQPRPILGPELRGATLGVIGYGRISRCLCDLALAFGMRVLVSDPYASADNPAVTQLELSALLREADHVVCLAVASQETENLMSGNEFACMKPTAFFLNPSRGNLVDEAALLDALERGLIAGCALDVGRAEDQMPSLELARHPRVLATPHLAGLTPALDGQSAEAIEQVAAILQGRVPPGALNAEHASRLNAGPTGVTGATGSVAQ